MASVQVEIHFHRNDYRDGLPVLRRGIEFPGFYRMDSFGVESASKRTNDLNARGKAFLVYND